MVATYRAASGGKIKIFTTIHAIASYSVFPVRLVSKQVDFSHVASAYYAVNMENKKITIELTNYIFEKKYVVQDDSAKCAQIKTHLSDL